MKKNENFLQQLIICHNQQIETNQFAVTRFKKEYGSTLDAITDARLPGVFFIYEFGPMLIKYSEQHRSTLHFLTNLCAIIGGILTGKLFIYDLAI